MPLDDYKKKRQFATTPEPAGHPEVTPGGNRFVIHKHDASRLHYDLRLEHDGVLKSWAVPKGPSLNPSMKHLAIMVEDHPLEYGDFEGVIPEGNYGAGQVMVWDAGSYTWAGPETGAAANDAMTKGLAKGHISFVLNGSKLRGEFALVLAPRAGKNAWLLIKKRDEGASIDDVLLMDRSVQSGRAMEEIIGPALGDIPEGEMPEHVEPMLATLVATAGNKPGWIFEVKYDGYRTIGQARSGKVRLYSRNDKDLNDRFPAVATALAGLGRDIVVDGEVVALDERGRPSFQLLQDYPKAGQGELVYYVFDLLWLDGRDLMDLPLARRKQTLRQLIPANSTIAYADGVEERGADFYKAAAESGLEGIVAKDLGAPYTPGARTRAWQKVKARLSQEAVIGGYTAPKGGRNEFGSLLVGVYEGKNLVFAGHVGTGFNEATLKAVMARLKPLAIKRCPFTEEPKTNAPAEWVKPELVAEIEFAEWTKKGVMRQPSFIGLRDDKAAADVIAETPVNESPSVQSGRSPLTHLDKVYWPEDGLTKGDMIDYYSAVAQYILPHLKDRPQSLHRFPNGLLDEGFWQKNADEKTPAWIETVPVLSREDSKTVNYMLCQDQETLLYMANLGCIEMHPWLSRTGRLDSPDFAVIDLDPLGIAFEEVARTALTVRGVLEEAGIKGLCKTSGATGLHIYLPLRAGYSYDQARQFAELLCVLTNKRLPGTTSLARSPADRQGKVYLDYLQNRKGATVASVYSLRPRPGAPVSTPLGWDELESGVKPADFNIRNILERLEDKGDLWAPTLAKKVSIVKVIGKLKSQV